MKQIFKKLIKSVLTIFCIITLTFYLIHMLPSNLIYNDSDIDGTMKEAIIQKYNLDKSINEQYILYLKDIFKGDLGKSIKYEDKNVSDVILSNFPVSLSLGIRTLILSIIIGVPLGIYSSINKKMSKYGYIISYIVISIPSFVIIGFLQLLVVYVNNKFNIRFPITGFDTELQKMLPVLSLSFFTTCMVFRVINIKIREEMDKEYVQFYLSLGYDKKYVIKKHILKNILPTIITTLTPQVISLITGSFIVETLFGIPGLGKYYTSSIIDRDYTMVIGLTLFYSIVLILCITLMDIITLFLDKRIEGEI
ncbi:ABC transporter permease [Pseudostreptobacillus hongkongensis]|uniref:ABC transporter permease n=1 Tax=Pseudostreptobacillus hongkongensis TaxID=1162717 RepID=UPI0028D1D89D|nr:ABC transporter permease [Pseudostreptobacillus hongkongensis]